MSTQVVSSDQPIQQNSCCKVKYKMRWFYSKGTILVLIWTVLVCAAGWSLNELVPTLYLGWRHKDDANSLALVNIVPALALVISAPLSGWLADARYGNYRVFRAGCILLFLGVVITCPCVLIMQTLLLVDSELQFVISTVIAPIALLLGLVGCGTCLVTSMQMGLDQMPDASAANITSYSAWYIISFFVGSWLSNGSFRIVSECSYKVISIQIWSLFPVFCMCIVLCSDFILSRKWLIIEPKSPQSLKHIFQVLKFAKQHKVPIQRSAFTFWEEDIPSRIDFGKSKYGGPFTTEQVEDVKTFLKLMILFLPVWITLFALSLQGSLRLSKHPLIIPSLRNSSCAYNSVYASTYNPFWSVIVAALLYEFFVYPLFRNKLPSILRRVGVASFLGLLLNIAYLILSTVYSTRTHTDISVSVWPRLAYSILFGFVIFLLINYSLEYLSAQSPYSMRGLLFGYVSFHFFFFLITGELVSVGFEKCTGEHSFKYCGVVQSSLAAALSIIGFILHCILARWYKRRVRDDDYHPQRVVEEVYDRYLSHYQ